MKSTSKKKVILATIFLSATLLLLVSSAVQADNQPLTTSNLSLTEGKNSITFDSVFYVKDLVKANPEIEAVSYTDSLNNETIGYVNFLGGIGKNFVIVQDRTYEIISNANTTLRIPLQ